MAQVLKDKDYQLINQQLADLQAIQADLEKAKKANIPGAEELEKRCKDCQQRCEQIKSVYFPERK